MPGSTDRIALVTGASRGLGAAAALWLAARGAHVVAVARTVGGLEELDDRIKAAGGAATLAPLDICDDGAMQHLCRSIHDRWGRVDVWVHAAVHATPATPAPQISAKDRTRAWATNVEAAFRLVSYVAPLLPPDGHAIHFHDTYAPEVYAGTYGPSKAAQRALFASWAEETQRTGPRVHVLSPDPMPTATRHRFYPGEDKSTLAHPDAEADRLLSPILAQT